MIDYMSACNFFPIWSLYKSIVLLFLLPIAITPQYSPEMAEILTDHWFFPLDNKEVIKRSLRKMQYSWVFNQQVTYTYVIVKALPHVCMENI